MTIQSRGGNAQNPALASDSVVGAVVGAPPRVVHEWSRLKVWVAPIIAVFGAGVSAAFLVAAKADRSELVEVSKKIDEVKVIGAALDKTISLSNQRLEFVSDRLAAIENMVKWDAGSFGGQRPGPSGPPSKQGRYRGTASFQAKMTMEHCRRALGIAAGLASLIFALMAAEMRASTSHALSDAKAVLTSLSEHLRQMNDQTESQLLHLENRTVEYEVYSGVVSGVAGGTLPRGKMGGQPIKTTAAQRKRLLSPDAAKEFLPR